ncbi:MAG: DUF1592 domain-containing protein [Opitutaceae bacterium]
MLPLTRSIFGVSRLRLIAPIRICRFGFVVVLGLFTALLNGHGKVESPDLNFGAFTDKYCIDCHHSKKKKGKLDLTDLLKQPIESNTDRWTDVLIALEDREMPPTDEPDLPRPSETEYTAVVQYLDMVVSKTPATSMEGAHGEFTPAMSVLEDHCTACHSGEEPQSGLDMEQLIREPLEKHADRWEGVIRKLNARQMPPHGKRWPDPKTYASVIDYLETSMDAQAEPAPNPGRTSTFRRLTRYEYENAVRDLIGFKIDAAELLPRDEVSHGFDNITVTELTPTLMDRYISAAQKIARLAVGTPLPNPTGDTIRVKSDITQNDRVEGLPLGTRGGIRIPYNFPRTGKYAIEVRLTRDRNEFVEGLSGKHEMVILLNDELLQKFEITRPKDKSIGHDGVDAHLKLEGVFAAGEQEIGVTFLQRPDYLLDRKREPLEASFNHHRHPRVVPAVFEVSIIGPFQDQGVGETAGRRIIFGADYEGEGSLEQAEQIIRRLARQAYRRPVTEEEVTQLLDFYRAETALGADFEGSIEAVVSAILVNPNFLFRVEREPSGASGGDVYAVSDLELASRLSFFLWSSLPDEALIALAERGELSSPETLEAQTLRMLADPRASSLAENFAAQWLYLRNVSSVTPDQRLYPDFDDNLRQAMRRESELLFEDVMRTDRNVLDLITSEHTYLNERIARHYEIPGVYGNRFRKVEVSSEYQRGGLLRHGSILSVTSYANRTSPVIRGAWILENLVGAPPPPPPPNVSTFDDEVIDENLPIRARLELHRSNPQCASCHELMDPIGFALESYDAIGKLRHLDNEAPIDASGIVADGTRFTGVADLEAYILKYPENFVRNMVEKLMTYGLGRGVEHFDMPTVRQIVRESKRQNYTFSSLINGIVQSHSFKHRIVQ